MHSERHSADRRRNSGGIQPALLITIPLTLPYIIYRMDILNAR